MAGELPLAAKRPSRWKMAAYLALTLLLVGVFIWQFREVWPEIARDPARYFTLRPGLAALALIVFVLCSLLDVAIWNRTLGWFTAPLPFRLAAPVYIWSYLARYIPGKVGSLILRVALARDVQRAAVPVLVSSAVELALRIAAALLLFLLVLWGWMSAQYPLFRALLVALVPLVLACAHPRVMLPVLNWLLRKMKQPALTQPLRYREVLGVFLALLLRWGLYGLGFYLLGLAVTATVGPHLLALAGLGAGAWVAGFVSGLPGGSGVMELVQTNVLATSLGVPTATGVVLSILLRLWTLLAEGLWALAGWVLWTIGRRQPQPETEQPEAVG